MSLEADIDASVEEAEDNTTRIIARPSDSGRTRG
jgi:hypothetical protein